MKNKITDEQIIQSARRQRKTIDQRMDVEPWNHRRQGRGIAAVITIAASLISFIAGYGIHAGMSKQESQPVAQVVQVQHDTIMQVETIRDTIYQTRIVSKHTKPKRVQPTPTTRQRMLASNEVENSPTLSPARQSSDEQMACSMLCDDIPYALLATPQEGSGAAPIAIAAVDAGMTLFDFDSKVPGTWHGAQ